MDGLDAKSPDGVRLLISGMTCVGCANTVTRVLTRVQGVESAKADFESGRAVVVGKLRPKDLITAVEAAGYGAQVSDSANLGEQDERDRNDCC